MKQFRVKNRRDLVKDLLIGVVIAWISIPLSIGYAQAAGLPPQYGLYGSLIPPLAFGLLSSSPRFVVGVDAAPAALIATLLPELGIAPASADAPAAMVVITALTGVWLLIFWAFKGGRYANYISEPVLGGCVSGIASVVILAHVPQLFGGSVTQGRAPALLAHIVRELPRFNWISFLLGVVTLSAIVAGRRRTRMSVSVIMMILGCLLNTAVHLERYGVAMVAAIEPGPPKPPRIDLSLFSGHAEEILIDTLAIALVIAAETLTLTRKWGRKYQESIDNQKEVLAYSLANLAAGFFGSSPVIGSISRTKRANRLNVTSQWMSVSLSISMALFLLFGTPLLSYLPQSVLTGIMIGALINILEFDMVARLWKVDRHSVLIFFAAFTAEMLGLAEGVIVGLILSFASFTVQSSVQPSYFLGCVKGEEGFFDLNATPDAKPVRNTVLYQFNGALFFATMDKFEADILNAVTENTRLAVITGIFSVDAFGAERLMSIYRAMKERGIRLFLAGHANAVNEQLKAYGADELISDGAVTQRLTYALANGGIFPPYQLERE